MHINLRTGAKARSSRCGLALANWSERWFPDPLVFAFIGIVVVFLIGLLLRESPSKLAIAGGKSFWSLVPFTMQMVMIIIGGYVVASTPLVYRAIRWLAGIPKTPRGAIALVALFSMLTSLISWGLSLIFSGLYVRELSQRVKGLDYRAAGAAAYLGLGAVWAMGLSSSAAMLMATKSAIPPSLFAVSGLIPLTRTLFLWQSIAHDGGADCGVGAGGVPIGAVRGKRAHGGRLRHRVSAHSRSYGSAHQAGRVAGIQSGAQHPGCGVAGLVPDRRVSHLAAGRAGRSRPEYLQPDVPHRGNPAALAAQAIHESGERVRARDRRRADSVSVLRRDLRDDRRHRHFGLAGPVCLPP